MELWEKIVDALPETADNNYSVFSKQIYLQDDGDGIAYIKKWEYSKPIPDGLTLGKPTA